MGQESAVARKSQFSDRQLAGMGVAKILLNQEYTHVYRTWKNIDADDFTWVRFKAHFKKVYLDREEIEQTADASG